MGVSSSDHIHTVARFLLRCYSHSVRSILFSQDPLIHYPLVVDFAELTEAEPAVAHLLFSQPTHFLPLLDDAARLAQGIMFEKIKDRESAILKEFVHVRVNAIGSPLEFPETFPSIGRVRVKHRGILLTLKGTVIRTGSIKMIEGEREYQCRKCKHIFKVYPELETGNSVRLPTSCPAKEGRACEGSTFQFTENSIICHDYQEIKIQESTQVLSVGSIPRSIPVILKDDLVDMVKAGDDIIVSGVLSSKWSPDLKDVRCNLDPMLIANHVRKTNELKSDIDVPEDAVKMFRQFWSDFKDSPLKGGLMDS